MTAGQKLYEMNGKMTAVFSDAAAAQAKINKGDAHLGSKVVGVLGCLAGGVTALSFGIEGGAASPYLLILGVACLGIVFFAFAKVMLGSMHNGFASREFSSRHAAAQTEYRRVLEDEAELHGIDPGSVKSREREGEENTNFTATRNNIPVSLTVEEQAGTMVIKVNGNPIHEVLNA